MFYLTLVSHTFLNQIINTNEPGEPFMNIHEQEVVLVKACGANQQSAYQYIYIHCGGFSEWKVKKYKYFDIVLK